MICVFDIRALLLSSHLTDDKEPRVAFVSFWRLLCADAKAVGGLDRRQGAAGSGGPSCCCSSVVERVLGKDEVMGSTPISSLRWWALLAKGYGIVGGRSAASR